MSADGLKTATGAKLAGLLLPGNFPTHRTHRSPRPLAVHTDRGTGSDCQPPQHRWVWWQPCDLDLTNDSFGIFFSEPYIGNLFNIPYILFCTSVPLLNTDTVVGIERHVCILDHMCLFSGEACHMALEH